MRRRPCLPIVLVAWLLAHALACLELPAVDLEGPRVVDSTLRGPRSVELSVRPQIAVELSEALDPASVHGGTVALVEWEIVGDCSLTPTCEEGSCNRGRCQVDPLGAGDEAAIDRGEFGEGVELELELGPGEAGSDTRLLLRPARPLRAHWRHSLILGAGLRDRSGAPLVDDEGQISAWRRDFVTAAAGSAGPEPQLVSPAPGQREVPTNVVSIETSVFPPVPMPTAAATLILEGEGGGQLTLVPDDPPLCAGWAKGTCLRWRGATFEPNTRYRPIGGSFVDRLARPASRPGIGRETWFEVGPGPDLEPPTPSVEAQLRARCLALHVEAGEALALELRVEPGALVGHATVSGAGWIGVDLQGQVHEGDSIAWTLSAVDLAGNRSKHEGELAAGPSFDGPALRITEILANPLGPEPDAEFVEVQALGTVASEDLVISDRSFAQLRADWLAGEEPAGDPLGHLALEAGEIALIVSSKWAPALGGDPPPDPGTTVVTVDASLGSGGLKNAGEPVSLWRLGPEGPVVVAGYGDWIDSSSSDHGGRSVVAGADSCDLPDRWRSHPLGRSSPGSLP